MSAEHRLQDLGIELPPPISPMGDYVPAQRSGSLLFLSGHGPVLPGGGMMRGRVGDDLTLEQGREAARLTGLSLLATLRQELGSLDAVGAVVKLLGFVRVAPGFEQLPAVIDGCSQLMGEVFGDAGRHARAAVGAAELPFAMPVEIELIAEISA